VYLSDPLREAIYAHSSSGTAFLHVPKAAGSAVLAALEKKHPVLHMHRVCGAHEPGCTCRSAQCRARARHELTFLSRLKGGRPWILNLGHFQLTSEEAQDIPAEMPIIVPMRNSEERLISYFRYYWTMVEAAQRSRVLVTRRHTFTWMLASGVPRGKIPRLSRDPHEVLEVQQFQFQPINYVQPDGYGIRWRKWLDDALSEESSPFLYRDLLPDLRTSSDLRWSRLVPMSVTDVVRWAEKEMGTRVRPRNVSRRSSSQFDLAQAMQLVGEVAADRVAGDAELWRELSSQSRANPSARHR
jgi:hypothetical protein